MSVKGPTAKTILRRSIEDIEAGHWCQNEIGKRNGTTTACAVGLLSMHADYGKTKGEWFYPNYPDPAAPNGVIKALELVYDALPDSHRKKYDRSLKNSDGDLGFRIDLMTQAVTGFNDRKTTNARKAAQWFKDALAKATK